MKDMCIICRRPKIEHVSGKHGAWLNCPVVTHYTPCKHERRQGTGCISSAPGHSWSDETCSDCGERLIQGTPPYAVPVTP